MENINYENYATECIKAGVQLILSGSWEILGAFAHQAYTTLFEEYKLALDKQRNFPSGSNTIKINKIKTSLEKLLEFNLKLC